jgi:L-ribulokinase
MQLFADTTGRPVTVPASSEVPARGAALFGAVAAGHFADIGSAIAATAPAAARTYRPDGARKAVYDEVYAIYAALYERLGRSEVELLHGLKRIRAEAGAS